jgi:DNA-binding PadR family transcriptional regulator
MNGVKTDRANWMRGASTPLRGALLGLLLERPGHGGDLANRLAARLGDTWRVDTNDVYRLLVQLGRSGLVEARDEPKRSNERRTHLVYHPTAETAGALTTWMQTLLPREPVRLGLHAKLAVARLEDAPLLMAALRAHERECQALAQALGSLQHEPQSWAAMRMESAREAAHAQLQSEADWAAQARRRIGKFLGRGL